MREHIETCQMTEEELDWDQHPHEREPPVQHDARLGMMDAAQNVPGAGGRNAHTRRQKGSEQHVRPAHRHDWSSYDSSPICGNDLAVDDRVTERYLHPTVVSEDPERRKHRPE